MTRDDLLRLQHDVLNVVNDDLEADEDLGDLVKSVFDDYIELLDAEGVKEPVAEAEPNRPTGAELLFAALTVHGRVTDARNLPRREQERLLQDLWSTARYA